MRRALLFVLFVLVFVAAVAVSVTPSHAATARYLGYPLCRTHAPATPRHAVCIVKVVRTGTLTLGKVRYVVYDAVGYPPGWTFVREITTAKDVPVGLLVRRP
jgi:hypothetical protein